MSMINTYMLRRFRRRPLVTTSCLGIAACMFISGLFTMWIKEGKSTLTWIPVVSILLYVITSMIGLLPIPWTMTAELFPIEIRGIAHSIAYSMANLLMFVSVKVYPFLQTIFDGAHGVQWFFAVMALAGMVYSIVFLPETHGKKLKDIEKYFVSNTIYFGSNSVNDKKTTKKTTERKPIVKNTRASDKDYIKAPGGQSDKMIAEV